MNVHRTPFGRHPRLRVYNGGLGEEDQAAAENPESSTPSTSDREPSAADLLIEQVLPTVSTLVEASASRDPAVWNAKIDNYREMQSKLRRGSVAWTALNNRIRVLEAKRDAALKGEARREELEGSRREWSTLGKVGLTVGIGVGAAAIALLAAATGRQRRMA